MSMGTKEEEGNVFPWLNALWKKNQDIWTKKNKPKKSCKRPFLGFFFKNFAFPECTEHKLRVVNCGTADDLFPIWPWGNLASHSGAVAVNACAVLVLWTLTFLSGDHHPVVNAPTCGQHPGEGTNKGEEMHQKPRGTGVLHQIVESFVGCWSISQGLIDRQTQFFPMAFFPHGVLLNHTVWAMGYFATDGDLRPKMGITFCHQMHIGRMPFSGDVLKNGSVSTTHLTTDGSREANGSTTGIFNNNILEIWKQHYT